MLLGRKAESARLDALLTAARAGESGTLVIRGEAGIGKSSLLAYAKEHATDFRALGARGVESEAELAFAALADLLRPILSLIESIPEPQAAALAGALALGPPAAADRFASCAATFSVLAAAAAEKPLLVLVDDAQWIDRSSAEAILFAARRLEVEPALVLFAVRAGEPSFLDDATLPKLELAGLEPAAAHELLGDRVVPEVAARLVEATANGGAPSRSATISPPPRRSSGRSGRVSTTFPPTRSAPWSSSRQATPASSRRSSGRSAPSVSTCALCTPRRRPGSSTSTGAWS
jgi:hypothetical protein